MSKRSITDNDSKKKVKKTKIIIYDPISLEEIGEHIFKYKRPNGSIIRYNITTLIEYLLYTGDFREPETKIEFTDNDLKKLDKTAIKYGLKYNSTLDAKKNNMKYYKEKKDKKDTLLSLERISDEYVTHMLNIIESDYDIGDAEIDLLCDIFPPFIDSFINILKVDSEYAYQCITNYISFIKGPENKPNKDNINIMSYVIDFLNSMYNQEIEFYNSDYVEEE